MEQWHNIIWVFLRKILAFCGLAVHFWIVEILSFGFDHITSDRQKKTAHRDAVPGAPWIFVSAKAQDSMLSYSKSSTSICNSSKSPAVSELSNRRALASRTILLLKNNLEKRCREW